MKVSKKQQSIQKKINQLLLAGIPLATLIPLQASAQAPENKGIPMMGKPVRPIKTNIKVETQIHIVQAGETMTKIARMYNSSVSELCRLNGIAIKAAGGDIEIIRRDLYGHHPHGLDDPTPLTSFILRNYPDFEI